MELHSYLILILILSPSGLLSNHYSDVKALDEEK